MNPNIRHPATLCQTNHRYELLSNNAVTSPPAWFQQYTRAPRDDRFVEVEGASIHYQRWAGDHGSKPGLIFVHGNGAHAHWWDFIAPAFAGTFDIVAPDLSGAGDSDHRPRYTPVTFAMEILGVARDAAFDRPVIVGHSFGGSMARIAGYLHGDELGGIVLVDSAISRSRGRRQPPPVPRGGVRYYDSLPEAVRRFRLRPPQACDNDYILDYIARHSIRKTERGYCYKLDQSLFSRMTEYDLPDDITMLREIPCRTALIHGRQSRFFPPEQVSAIEPLFGPALIEGIDGAHHHVFLDQPLKFIETLTRMLNRLNEARGEPWNRSAS